MEKNKVEKVYDQIHAPESLKQETLEKMLNQKETRKVNYSFILSIAALFIFTFALGFTYYFNKPDFTPKEDNVKEIAFEVTSPDLLHFQNINELREYFEKNYNPTIKSNSIMKSEASALEDIATNEEETYDSTAKTSSQEANYYKTNTQVENVDEADIVKTDGEYIYYVTNSTVYIVKADTLNLDYKFEFDHTSNSNFSANELFINDNKLIIIGSYWEYSEDNDSRLRYYNSLNKSTTRAYIYDISDKTDPKELRKVEIDGNYISSRLIGNSLYLISIKYKEYYPEMKDDEILPLYYDSAISNEYKNVDCKNIVYNENSTDNSYQIIGAVDINSDEEIKIETFLGYGSTIYCSENNLYIASPIYNEGTTQVLNSTKLYKFNISSGGLKYVCENTVDGNVNNQFSLDEYDGNLRIATTVTIQEKPDNVKSDEGYDIVKLGETTTNNILYVLDENLQEIGKLTDFGLEEKIYSVRFIGKVGYIVTFEQIDPLFVIDLSDPRNPTLKGELEIPGYSSYLHPYDETHIIGIGYNVKDNGYGGVTNETLKISMFDVSDLENPKEIFSKTLGKGYSYSSVTYDHKLLMYDKQRNLIGFPINMRNEKGKTVNSIILLNIDLENKEFKIHSQYSADNFNFYIRKVIYIEDTIYLLCDNQILAFDINTLENTATVQLPYDEIAFNTKTMYVVE